MFERERVEYVTKNESLLNKICHLTNKTNNTNWR